MTNSHLNGEKIIIENFSSNPSILFLTGASGVGKTSIVTMLAAQNTNPCHIFQHADTDGVACLKGITEIEQAKNIEQYQEIATHKWVEKVKSEYQSTNTVVMEGQARFHFVKEACEKYGVARYIIVLIDCDWKIMRLRLTYQRQQPELVTNQMRNWANFLRQQARSDKIPIVDTSKVTVEQAVQIIQSRFLQP